MQISKDTSEAQYEIKAHEQGLITIGETGYMDSLIVSENTLITDWSPQQASDLLPEHLAALLALKPDVILIGTGETQYLFPPHILEPIYQKGIGVETMTTPAACRTFNVLLSENRAVAAGLFH